MCIVNVAYPDALDIGCFSHTLDHVGESFQTQTLDEFSSLWITLFLHSQKAKFSGKSKHHVQ